MTLEAVDANGASTGFTATFEPLDTLYVQFGFNNIVESTLEVFDESGNLVSPSDYEMRLDAGAIRAASHGSLSGDTYSIKIISRADYSI